jgi:L-aminopeptidase/D-esterase-like protein
MNRMRYVVSVAAATFAFLSLAAQASSTTSRVIGRSSASGDYAVTIASGTTKRPLAIKMRVLARPNQHVTSTVRSCVPRGLARALRAGRSQAGRP